MTVVRWMVNVFGYRLRLNRPAETIHTDHRVPSLVRRCDFNAALCVRERQSFKWV